MAIVTLTRILTSPLYSKRPYLSADGRSLVLYVEGNTYFSGGKDYTKGLVILDLVDGSVVPMTPPGAAAGSSAHPEVLGMNADASQVYFWAISNPETGARTVYLTDAASGATAPAVAYPGAAPGVPASFGAMSTNGRYMVVDTEVQAGQYFGGLQWRDRQTGEARMLESVAHTLREGDPSATAVSDDGRKVLFHTFASNVVAGDTNGNGDYFVQDMVTGKAVAVQTSTGGVIGNGFIFNAVMSANGRYVAFESNSTNLVADGLQVPSASYVKDLQTGAIVRVSEDAGGTPFAFSVGVSSISADGRYVTLISYDDAGLAGPLDPSPRIFVKDLQTGGLGLVNRAPSVNTSTVESSQISANGEMVAYMGVKMEERPTLHPVFHVFVAPRPALTTAAVDGRHAGGADADTLAGALGNDSYEVNHAGDIVLEYAGQGADTISTTLDNYVLPDNVEHLRLGGSALNGNGNALDNQIRGTVGNNILRGGAGDDILEGGGGSDTLHGDAGFDIVRFSGSVKDVSLTKTSWRHEVKNTVDGTVSYLHGVEHLRFADAEVSFATEGVAAQAYRIYQAAFDRKPDLAGLGYWISRMEAGMSIDEVARHFVDALEFKVVFGANASNRQLVEGMYQHVLHRPGEAAGLAFWVDVLDRGAVTRAEVLKQFSESPENQAALIGVIGHGIAYQPYHG